MILSISPDGSILAEMDNHTITVPRTVTGLGVLIQILEARMMEPRPKIATPASPTQAQVEEMVLTFRKTVRVPPSRTPVPTVEEILNAIANKSK